VLPRIAKIIIGLSKLSYGEKRSVVYEMHRRSLFEVNGVKYTSPLRGKAFWVWLISVEVIRRPVFYLAGIPVSIVLYFAGIYGLSK